MFEIKEYDHRDIDTSTHRKRKHNAKLECEVLGLRKELEKKKYLNPRFSKGSEILNEIIKVQHSHLINTSLGYTEDSFRSKKSSTSTIGYLDATKTNEQYVNRQQKPKSTHKVNHGQFTPRMNINRRINQKVKNTKRFYDHINFFHK